MQSAAHEPPLVETHVSFAQQSVPDVHAPPGCTHVAAQKPRGSQTIVPVFARGAQQPDAQSAPVVQGSAHAGRSPAIVGAEQMPEQHAFGALVQSAPAPRHALVELLDDTAVEDWAVLSPASRPVTELEEHALRSAVRARVVRISEG